MKEIQGYRVEIKGNIKFEISKEQFEDLEKILFSDSPPEFIKLEGRVFKRDSIISINPFDPFGICG